MSSQEKKESVGKVEGQPHRIRLRGIIKDEEIGLGDAIKRVTYAMGIKPCAGCEKRAAALNRLDGLRAIQVWVAIAVYVYVLVAILSLYKMLRIRSARTFAKTPIPR
jgi:hypothetical protein